MKQPKDTSRWTASIRHNEALLILVLGLMCTLIAAGWSHWQLERAESNLIAEYESKVADRFRVRFDSYLSLLLQTKSFLELNPSMSAESFKKYMGATDLRDVYPGLPYVGYIEATMVDEELVSARVRYTEPDSAADRSLRFRDLSADPQQYLAMTRAAVTGEPAISNFQSHLPELQEFPAAGFAIYLPVYAQKEGDAPVLSGFVYSPLVAKHFLKQVFSGLASIPLPVRAEVYQDGARDQRLVYRSIQGDQESGFGAEYDHLTASSSLELGSQSLILEIAGTPGLFQLWSRSIPLLVLILGGLLSFLVYLLVRTEKDFSNILREQKNEIELITDAVPILIGYISDERRFSFLNRAHRTWFKKVRRTVVGRRVEEVLGRAYYSNIKSCIDRAFQGERLTYRGSYSTRKGTEKHYETTLVPHTNSRGEVSGVFFSSYDVTEAVLFTEHIKRSEERLKLINHATNDVVWEWDLESDNVTWNDQAYEKFGYKPEEIDPKLQWWKDRVHPEDLDHVLQVIGKYKANTDRQWQVEYRFCKANGEYAAVIDRGTLLERAPGHPAKMVGAMMDITQLREAEKSLACAKEAAERANGAKTAFLANMSHEIRTPLGAIIGFTDLCLEDSPSERDLKVWLSKIKTNSTHLLSLIDEILDISKVEAGKLEMGSERVPLRCLLRDVHSLLISQAAKKGVELTFGSFQSLPKEILSDQKRIKQILINLVGNSIKFTSHGKVEVVIYIRRETSDQLVFEVRDTGIGMTEEEAGKLFMPFSQADSSISRKYGGSGLGLVLSREFCQKLGGDLKLVRSTPGHGSLFEASIELKVEEDVEYINGLDFEELFPDGPASAVGSTRTLEGCRILLVEDSADNQMLISKFLDKTGVQLDLAWNGQEAVEKASKRHYDIVLMDIQMPVVDGYTATRILRETGHTEPILALTAHAFRDERLRCYEAGCNDHLTKPIDRTDLVSKIGAHLGQRWHAPRPGPEGSSQWSQIH